MRHFITSIDSILFCVCQHALDAPLESTHSIQFCVCQHALDAPLESTHSIQFCVCQHALDAPLESSAGLGNLLWRTPSAPESGFGCKKQDIGMDLSLFLEKNLRL